jgi:hypothetical protein
MIRFFRVTPPTVHQMVLSLEKAGLISRKPGIPRSIAVLLERSAFLRAKFEGGSTSQNHCDEVLEWLPSDSPPSLRWHASFDLVQNERLLSDESRSIPPSMPPDGHTAKPARTFESRMGVKLS